MLRASVIPKNVKKLVCLRLSVRTEHYDKMFLNKT